ncbi:MAG: ABC transporter ATP-binding protein [Bacilli bacterium]|nr:ABC transporter ATP-binding protein [Bacilli bacterium]
MSSTNSSKKSIRHQRRHGGPGGNTNAVQRPDDFGNSLKKLIKYSRPFYPILIIALVLSILSSILQVSGPNYISDLTKEIGNSLLPTATLNLDKVTTIGITLVVIYALSFVTSSMQNYLLASYTRKTSRNLRRDLTAKLNVVPLKYLDEEGVGDILSRFTNDIDTLAQSLNGSIGQLISGITLLIGSVIMMFYTNWIMALTAIGSSLLGFALMILIISKSQKQFRRQQRHLGTINGQIEEIYTGHDAVKSYNALEIETKKFERTNRHLYDSAWKSQFFSGLMMPIMQFIGNFGYVAVCVVGSIIVANDPNVGFEVVVAFMIYVRLFTNPLASLAQAMTSLQSAMAANERVFEVLDQKEMEKEDGKIAKISKPIKGEISFENVEFGYSENKTIIHNFSAQVKPGQKIAIVGPTGAGKTTMVNLLMRFYEINKGKILIDGVDTKKVTRALIHEQFGMVLQDTWLFNGTIRENILYSKKDVTDEEMIRATKAVGLHHFIMTLPKNYDTILDEKTSLSSGQKQLITIARAMVQNSPLLILDEATSSVDTRTEILIQEAMDKLTKGRTSFVIAHRLSTIKNADLILVMNHGNIVEKGNHKELLAKNGFYANLYNSQFEDLVTA